MNILIIQPWISYRGAESISIDEVHGLRKLGHNASILCLFVDKDKLRKVDQQLDYILPVAQISSIMQKYKIIFFLFGFIVLLFLLLKHGRKFQIYNPHNFPGVWVAAIASYFYKKPVYWTVHNFPQHGFTNNIVSKLWEIATDPLDKIFVSKTKKIISVSEKVAGQVKRKYHKTSLVIYPCIDIGFFSQGSRKKGLGIIGDENLPVILIPTRFHKAKNINLTLNAIRQFSKTGEKALFCFAGDGNLRDSIITFREKNRLSAYIRCLGYLPKEKLRHLYAAASFVFLPGLMGEGFNVVPLEALSVHTPSLVLAGSGVDVWLKRHQSGFVVKPHLKDIVNMFLVLCNNASLRSDAAKHGNQVVKGYTPEQYAIKLITAFEN